MHRRTLLARRLSWLVVAALTTAALFAPGAISNAASVPPTHPTGNPTCADLGYSLSFKINTGSLENKTYVAGDGSVETNWGGQAITISGLSGDGQTFDFSSTLAVSAALVKAGVDNHNLYTYSPAVTSDTDLTHDSGQQGISHLLFCGNGSTPTPTTEPTPTASPTATPTTEPTPTPTPTPSAGQFDFPTIGIEPCTEVGGQGAIIVSGFEATNGGELVLNPGPDEIVITENGTFPLEPGTYTAIIRFDGETVAGPVEFVIGPCPTPTPTPTTEPTPTPTPTPSAGQFDFPTIGIEPCTEVGGQGAIIVSGFEATNGGELVLNPGPDEIVITENGTFPLEPGTYTAIIRFDGETVAGPVEFVIGPCPTPTPTPTTEPTPTPTPTPSAGQFDFPTIGIEPCTEVGGQGAIIVSGFEATNGGELVLNPGPDEIVITENGTFPLEPGTYTAIIRFDGETVAGPVEFVIGDCPNDLPAGGTPTPAPSGGVLAATGLPSTDTIDQGPTLTGGGLRLALMAMAALLAAILLLMPASVVVRGKDRR